MLILIKINFTGVVELIDALGGVTVDVEKPDFQFNNRIDCKGQVCEQNSKRQFGSKIIYVPVGVNKLNGEQALAYARNRHQYAISDIARNQHQQQLIEATANELKNIRSVSEFQNLLTTVSRNIETNMTPEQMLSFYSVGKDMLINSSGTSLSIQKTYLSYYSLPVWLPRSGMYTSALGYYPESLEAITNLMKVNLELEEATPIKTFSISYNEDYKTPDFLKGGIMYQIFPDRFYKSGKKHDNVPTDRVMRENWEDTPYYRPDENGHVWNMRKV